MKHFMPFLVVALATTLIGCSSEPSTAEADKQMRQEHGKPMDFGPSASGNAPAGPAKGPAGQAKSDAGQTPGK